MSEQVRVAVLSALRAAYSREMALGVQSVARDRGWLLELLEPGNFPLGNLNRFAPQALILGAQGFEAVPDDRRRGLVLVGAGLEEHDAPTYGRVMVDDHAAGRMAAEHFATLGVRTVTTYSLGAWPFVRRRDAALRERLAELGIAYLGLWDQNAHRFDGPDTIEEASKPFIRWIRDVPRPMGVFCACDEYARSLVLGLNVAGVAVPEEVAVLGVDNDELCCEVSTPSISSVAFPWERMGAEAAELVDAALRGDPPPADAILIPPIEVVVRKSTDILAVSDEQVAATLAYIRDNATRQAIGVADLTRAVGLPRHRLHRVFRRETGRTLMQEVRRVRVDQAKRLLAHTTLNVAQIATRCGFANYRKLTIAFRQQTGLTPAQYRKRYRS